MNRILIGEIVEVEVRHSLISSERRQFLYHFNKI